MTYFLATSFGQTIISDPVSFHCYGPHDSWAPSTPYALMSNDKLKRSGHFTRFLRRASLTSNHIKHSHRP